MAGERVECVALSTVARPRVMNRAAKRLTDVGLSLALLAVAVAPMAVIALARRLGGKPVLTRSPRVGYDRQPFELLEFAVQARLVRQLPMLWNILKGEMSFVGPRPALPEEARAHSAEEAARFEVKPGLVCLHWIRSQANIAYEPETVSDAEYVRRQSFRTDAGILLRTAVALVPWMAGRRTGPAGPVARHLNILGIRFDNLSMSDTLDTFLKFAGESTPRQACFVYADCANQAQMDEEYRRVLEKADLVLADGLGLNLAGRMLGTPVRENLCGTDVFPRLCAKLAGTGKSVYLLGAQPGVADDVRDWIRRNHPGVIVAGCRHGFFTTDEEPAVLRSIAASKADVLLVAMGVPRQDKWIAENLAATGVKLALGVGALFDVYSGRMTRAPQWVREMGMEWVYRLCQEPRRLWKRYVLGNFAFLWRVYRQMRLNAGPGCPDMQPEQTRGALDAVVTE